MTTLNFEFPWQDLLTLPLPPELEQVEGEYVRHRLLRETMLEASTALALCPDPERDYPGGPGGVLPGPDAEGLQPCVVRAGEGGPGGHDGRLAVAAPSV